MKATIYDPKTGKILCSLSVGRLEDLDANLSDADAWIEGEYPPNDYYVEGDTPKAMPERPDFPCYFDYKSKSWTWDEERSWRALRRERNRLLTVSDWTQAPDAPVDQAAWAEYRQALRDIPQQAGFPHDVAWPVKP